jgi:hypothetical protein
LNMVSPSQSKMDFKPCAKVSLIRSIAQKTARYSVCEFAMRLLRRLQDIQHARLY